MTKELTKAAQAALNACERIVDQEESPVQFGIDFRALGSSLRRALTTSQPAQAGEVDRDPTKIEQAMRQAYGEFDSFLVGGCKGEPPRMSIAFASGLFKTIVREQGLFFTTPQQATPLQDVGASADYWGDLAQQKADADARRGVSMPVSYYTSSIVGALLATQQATPATPDDMKVYDGIAADYFAETQQATPEPVGEPVGTVVHAKLNGQAKPWVTVALNQDADLPDGTKLFTHPAPGVPDVHGVQWLTVAEHGLPDFDEEVICGLWYTDPWLKPERATRFMWGLCRVVKDDHRDFKDGKRWQTFGPSHNDITHWARLNMPALASAQAKGADPEDLAAAGVMLMGRRTDHA